MSAAIQIVGGSVLKTYLSFEHTENGTHKNVTVLGDFVVNGSRLYVNSTTGLIGIGTRFPTQKLTVIGNVNISGNLYVLNIFSDSINTNTIVVNSTLTADTVIVNKNLIVFGNVTNITISNLVVNGTLNPALDNFFDVGNGSLRWRNANFSGVIDANSLRVGGKDVQLILDAFNLNNFTSAYDARNDRFAIANFTAAYDSRTDRFTIQNLTKNRQC